MTQDMCAPASPSGSQASPSAADASSPVGADPSRVPFMPVGELTDDVLIDTGAEVITWGEYRRRRDSDGSAVGGETAQTGSTGGNSAGPQGIAPEDQP